MRFMRTGSVPLKAGPVRTGAKKIRFSFRIKARTSAKIDSRETLEVPPYSWVVTN